MPSDVVFGDSVVETNIGDSVGLSESTLSVVVMSASIVLSERLHDPQHT